MRVDEKSELHHKEIIFGKYILFFQSGQTVFCSDILCLETKNLQNAEKFTSG